MTFVPSAAGMHELVRSVNGPVAHHVDALVDRMIIEATATCPVGPPAEFPPGRWAHPPLRSTIERSRVYPTVDGVAARFGSHAPYAASVHDGARPHPIRARFAKVLRFRNKGGAVVFTAAVAHPGNKPNPWLLRAAQRILQG